MSDGDLAIDHIQELRAYVERGSPVLLSPEAAKHVLSIIERSGLATWEQMHADNERLRAELDALRPLADDADRFRKTLEAIAWAKNNERHDGDTCRGFAIAALQPSDSWPEEDAEPDDLNPRFTHPATDELRARGFKRINDPRKKVSL